MDGNKREAYLAKAAEAERIAKEVDETARPHWLELARGWRDLAAKVALLEDTAR